MTARAASLEAPAKINLFLQVLHRRADGFHELRTLFQMLSLCDLVRVTVVDGAESTVTLEVHGAELGPPEENLAWRAASDFVGAFGPVGAIHVELTKRIPAGAGLGGGSSDAAAVLRLLDFLARHPPQEADRDRASELHRVAAGLGSDVPFFVGASALAEGRGRGEVLTPLPALPRKDLVLSLPPVHVSTADAYAALAADRELRAEAARRPDVVLGVGGWAKVESSAENDFEHVVSSRHEEVARSLRALRAEGARPALLSGSGSACFGVFEGEAVAREVAARLEAELGWPFLATTTRAAPPLPRRE